MNRKILSFQIDPQEAGTRLDRCLSRLIPGSSRTYLQKLIADGLVTSEGTALTVPRYPVRAGMRVTVELPEPENTEPVAEPFDFPILYEDESMLVIAKPAGVVVHPAAGNPTGTVVNALLGRYPHLAETLACTSGRPGIIHRLDKETSGCLAIAKTPEAQYKLSSAFASRETGKTYLAIVRGVPRRPEGEITGLIGRQSAEDGRGGTEREIRHHPLLSETKRADQRRPGQFDGSEDSDGADAPDPGSSLFDRDSGARGCDLRGNGGGDSGNQPSDAARLEVEDSAPGYGGRTGIHGAAAR